MVHTTWTQKSRPLRSFRSILALSWSRATYTALTPYCTSSSHAFRSISASGFERAKPASPPLENNIFLSMNIPDKNMFLH